MTLSQGKSVVLTVGKVDQDHVYRLVRYVRHRIQTISVNDGVRLDLPYILQLLLSLYNFVIAHQLNLSSVTIKV
jgi:hypothetical protein